MSLSFLKLTPPVLDAFFELSRQMVKIEFIEYSRGKIRASKTPLSFYNDDSTRELYNHDETYRQKWCDFLTVELTCFCIGELCPNFFERPHLLASDGLRAASGLKDVGKVFNYHTSEHVQYDVLSKGQRRQAPHAEPYHAQEIPCNKK